MQAVPLQNNPAPDSESARRGLGGIFWRTFLLIAILIGVSLAAWYQSFRLLELSPRAQQAAALMVSIVNLTRSALIHSDPDKRRALLIDLAQNEGIRIYPLEPSDEVEPLTQDPFLELVSQDIEEKLGRDTRVTLNVNDHSGLFVSFFIDDDGYWVTFDRERLESVPRIQWLGWGSVALCLSLLGAVVISRLINLPLKQLASAAVAVGRGSTPAPLPERGPREVREANISFNAMMTELARIEADRALLLAGISHDLRTPLTRLRLEIEINDLDDATRSAMAADIEQMDSIIGQFLDYARPLNEQTSFVEVDLGRIAQEVVAERTGDEMLRLTSVIEPAVAVQAHPVEIKRVLLNLIENARRYGRTPGQDYAEVSIRVSGGNFPFLEVRDHGEGISASDIERLKRPFVRLESARSQADGAGLGLAIIERIAQRHRARFELLPGPGGGLIGRMTFTAGLNQERS